MIRGARRQRKETRRLVHWDRETLELGAVNAAYLPIREHSRDAVLCGQVIGRLAPAR